MEKTLEAFKRTLEVIDRLRKECPWDRKQTNESLRPLTIEECYELTDAIIAENEPFRFDSLSTSVFSPVICS